MYLKIFLIFLKFGVFCFGSGYALIPLMEKDLIYNYHLLHKKEFLDCLIVGQITPGPVAITSTFIGFKLGGVFGAFFATLGVFLPSIIFMIALSRISILLKENIYFCSILKGITPSVIGLILTTTVNFTIFSLNDIYSFIIFILILFSLIKLKIDYPFAILLGGALGTVRLLFY